MSAAVHNCVIRPAWYINAVTLTLTFTLRTLLHFKHFVTFLCSHNYVFTTSIQLSVHPCQHQLNHMVSHDGRRPAHCPCRWVHSCANMDNDASARAPNDSGQSSVLYLTSISETIQKAPLAEAKTALGKQKIRLYVECRYLSHYRNSVKNCFLTQNFTEIGQSAAELWPKKIFNTANLHLCNNFRQNPLIFCWDNVILRFAIRRFCNTAAILTFQNLDLCHMTSIAIIVCFPLQNFTKAYNRVLSHGQKRFLKWQPIAIMNFENFYIWSSGCYRFPNVQSCSSKSDDFCRAMLCKRSLCRHVVSVCLFVCHVAGLCQNKLYISSKFFSPSGSHAILVFPCQTA